jgi:Family of unknown function (DUF6011)
MTYSPPEAFATEKQTAFIQSLLEQRSVAAEVKASVEEQIDLGTITKTEASKRIEWLLAQPKVEKPKPTYADPPEGMHVSEGQTIKVYRTRSGHIVASALKQIDGVWGFEYQGKRGLKGLSDATRMPAEEAKAFGKTYGICVRCAKHLTDERSIYAGYGAWCANVEGWVYPKMSEAMEGLGFTSESDLIEPEATPAPALAEFVMPDDGDILTPEERAAYETRQAVKRAAMLTPEEEAAVSDFTEEEIAAMQEAIMGITDELVEKAILKGVFPKETELEMELLPEDL